MNKIPVFLFTEMSLLIALIIGLPLALKKEPEIKWMSLGGKNWFKICAQSLIGTMAYTVFNLYGLKYCDPVIASVIASLSPAVVMISAFLFLHEKITIKKIIGVFLAIVAVLVMTVDFTNSGVVKFVPLGILFIVLAILCQGLYNVMAKQISYDMPPYSMTAALVGTSSIMLLPFALYDLMHFSLSTLDAKEWAIVLYYGITVGYICYLFTYKAFRYVSATTFGACAAIVPVATAVVSVLFYSATLDIFDIIGIMLVVISVIVIENRENESKVDELIDEVTESNIE